MTKQHQPILTVLLEKAMLMMCLPHVDWQQPFQHNSRAACLCTERYPLPKDTKLATHLLHWSRSQSLEPMIGPLHKTAAINADSIERLSNIPSPHHPRCDGNACLAQHRPAPDAGAINLVLVCQPKCLHWGNPTCWPASSSYNTVH